MDMLAIYNSDEDSMHEYPEISYISPPTNSDDSDANADKDANDEEGINVNSDDSDANADEDTNDEEGINVNSDDSDANADEDTNVRSPVEILSDEDGENDTRSKDDIDINPTRSFKRTTKRKYTMEEKDKLGSLVVEKKKKYEELQHTKKGRGSTYIAVAVREFYPDLRTVRNSDPLFDRAIKLAERCYRQKIKGDDPLAESTSKKKARRSGGGRKVRITNVRDALFEWFIDIRTGLKARLPKRLFMLKCKELYSTWLRQQNDEVQKEHNANPVQFSNKWLATWLRDYHVSLKHPNKRYKVKQEDRVERIEEFIKNVWRVRKFFIERVGVDPPIVCGDQMPLHRNENADQRTLNFKGMDCYVKENYMLSRERVTAYTQVSSDPKSKFKPEFVFKGIGTRTKLSPPQGMCAQWALKGSYRLENMLKTISNLPNRHNLFNYKNYAIYTLDDYSVHIDPEVKKALLKRGYIYVGIGGGVTGDIQINDTDMHAPLKKEYRHLESKLMLNQLKADRSRIPQPSRDEMMEMLDEAWEVVLQKVDVVDRFKCLWLTNKLDGSEDYLVSEKIMDLVGPTLLDFRKSLMEENAPLTLQAMMRGITPPKGVRRKQHSDEGVELFDCDGDEIEDVENAGEVNDSEEEGDPPEEEEGEEEQEEVNPQSPLPSSSAPPQGDVHDLARKFPHLRKDLMALQDLKRLIEIHETDTSRLFKPFMVQLKTTYRNARLSVRKRMVQCSATSTSVTEGEDEDVEVPINFIDDNDSSTLIIFDHAL